MINLKNEIKFFKLYTAKFLMLIALLRIILNSFHDEIAKISMKFYFNHLIITLNFLKLFEIIC